MATKPASVSEEQPQCLTNADLLNSVNFWRARYMCLYDSIPWTAVETCALITSAVPMPEGNILLLWHEQHAPKPEAAP